MNKRENKAESRRHFKLSHQNVCITQINFQKESYVGFVEMQLVSQRDELKKIKVNAKQLRIYRVSILYADNLIKDCLFTYSDPTLDIIQTDTKRNLDVFSSTHLTVAQSVDPDRGNGELIIEVPDDIPEIVTAVKERTVIRLHIEFSVERPQGGVQFVVPQGDGSLAERGAHMFTYRYENSNRLWFPCVDSYSEVCTWRMDFTVDLNMVAVSCGDLVETVYTADNKKKTYHYNLSTPTCAPNIALAVGPFEIMVDPYMHEVTHFCLPHLLPLLRDTCVFLHEVFEFYEELLSSRYPYSCYKQVFVDEAYENSQSYATMTIFSTNLLHSRHIIDQTYLSRRILSHAIAEQFFGCFITMQSWADSWLTRGISLFVSAQYYKKAFGNNEYRFDLQKHLQDIIKYEEKYRGVVLDPSQLPTNETNAFYFAIKHLHTISPLYDKAHKKKSYLVIRMLENYLGRELLLQVFNKLLSLAINAGPQKFSANVWFNFMISTNSFVWAISTVTGKNIDTFLNQWVYEGGHAKFHSSFVFNRKRNAIEFEIKQMDTQATGIKRYVGPLLVTVQELDGTFKYTVQIEDNNVKHDLTCHSKSRRNKKKKIPLCTGEEVDMDLSGMDQDSPVLWLRIDPEMQLLREVVLEQPDYQWQYQLRYERDVMAQIDALRILDKYSNPHTRNALTDIINNEQCFYRVRCAATLCLRKVANNMASTWTGPPAMLTIFRKIFGSHSCPHIIKLNNFSKFQHYFLQKAMTLSMAGLRNILGICPQEVLKFLKDLLKYNDNSKNKFSDNYYRASLIDAISETVTPIVTAVIDPTGKQITPDALSAETKWILEEITRYLNLEKLLPCYKYTVSVSCLRAIRHLQRMGHLPSNSMFFREYAVSGLFIDVRKAALKALIDITKAEMRKDDLDFLLDLVENESISDIRLFILKQLVKNPPFERNQPNILNTENLVNRLWRLMNTQLSYNSRLRCAVVDLYYTLYGRGRPSCLPKPEFSVVLNLKEKKVSTSLVSDDDIVMTQEPQKETLKKDIEMEDTVMKEPDDSFNDISMSTTTTANNTQRTFDEIMNDTSLIHDNHERSSEIIDESILSPKDDEEDVPEEQKEEQPIVERNDVVLDEEEPKAPEEMDVSSEEPIVQQVQPQLSPPQQPVVAPKVVTTLSLTNITSLATTGQESKDKDKSKKDKEDGSGGHTSKPHKDKKKKKKKHKHKEHKEKHKHKHKDKDKDKDKDRDRHHSHERTGSSGGSNNASPVKHI
ncbi:transcription initiation factor TFIID subunit 2-like [Oppia nitens]|uniref:transcription initiation factor TFIID subunit 2-like n=1 Tax=Oppia nitens TaxID=1686743 RepID=UPI0023DB5A62|nr:transcription initiation factor TFIID subunit 2-like [Oppia nitens]